MLLQNDEISEREMVNRVHSSMLEEQLCPLHLQPPKPPEAVLQLTDLLRGITQTHKLP